jgi:hypothetical protein
MKNAVTAKRVALTPRDALLSKYSNMMHRCRFAAGSCAYVIFVQILLFLASGANAQWKPCGIVLSIDGRGDTLIHTLPIISADNSGGAYLVWEDRTKVRINISAQRINSNGQFQWGPFGIQVSAGEDYQYQRFPEILADSHGRGVFIAWEYVDRLQVQKVDSSGRVLWGPNGIPANLLYGCYGISLALDGSGGVYVASRGSTSTGERAPWVQHFDASGNRLWGDGGRILSNRQNNVRLRCTRVQRTVAGGVLAFWIESPPSGEAGDRNWAQRLDYEGNALWTPDGNPDGIPLSDTAGYQRYWLWTIADDRGGAFITWSSRLSYNETVQHIDSSGALLLGRDGLLFCDGVGEYDMTSDGDGGALIASNCWGYFKGPNEQTRQYYINRITSDNRVVWGDSVGVLVKAPGADREAGRNICEDGNGGAFIVYNKGLGGITQMEIWTQWVDSSRALRFGPGGLLLCSFEHGQRNYFNLAATAPGEAMLVWMDSRRVDTLLPQGTNCYVAKITRGGVVGLQELPLHRPSELELQDAYPNPSASSSSISCSILTPGTVRITLCNIHGQEIRLLHEAEHEPGSFTVPVDSAGLPDGTYFVTASVGQDVKVKKMLVIKR